MDPSTRVRVALALVDQMGRDIDKMLYLLDEAQDISETFEETKRHFEEVRTCLMGLFEELGE